MPSTDRLIAELADCGRHDSDGDFTLDRDKAREKMRLFQLPDPRLYVLELVQAAALKEARAVRFDIDADDMHMRCDGAPFTVADFDRLYGALLSSAETSEVGARRHLAVALNAAMALNPRSIRVTSGSAYVEMRPGREDDFGELDHPEEGTHVHVKARFRPGLVVRFFENISGRLAEETLITERCRFAHFSVDLEGVEVAEGLELDDVRVAVPFEADGAVGQVGLAPDPRGLRIVQNGVWIATAEPEGLMPGLVAVVNVPWLRRNVSRTDVVRDARYRRFLRIVRAQQVGLLVAAGDLVDDAVEGSATYVARLLRWALVKIPGVLSELTARAETDQRAATLLALPLATTVKGAPLSLAEIHGELEDAGALRSSRVALSELCDEDPGLIVHVKHEADGAFLEVLGGDRLTDATDHVRNIGERASRRLLWRARKRSAELGPSGYLARAPIVAEGVRGEVGLRAVPRDGLQLTLMKEGCTLVERSVDFTVVGLDAVIEADFVPTYLFDDVEKDELYGRAMCALLDALVPLFDLPVEGDRAFAWPAHAVVSFAETLFKHANRYNALIRLGLPRKLPEGVARSAMDPWSVPRLFGGPASSGEGHGLRRLPFVATLGGSLVSYEELEEDFEAHGHLLVADEGLPAPPPREEVVRGVMAAAVRRAFAVAGASDRPPGVHGPLDVEAILEGRPIVARNKLSEKVLRAVAGRKGVWDLSEGLTVLAEAKAFLSLAPEPPRIPLPTRVRVDVGGDGVSGELGLLEHRGSELDGRILVTTGGRPLGSIPMAIPVTGLTAKVDHDGLQPDASLKDVIEDEATGEVRRAVAAALPRLATAVVEALDDAGPSRDGYVAASLESIEFPEPPKWIADQLPPPPTASAATRVVGQILRAVFPSAALREAYDALSTGRGAEAEGDYRAILALGTRVGGERLHLVVSRRVEAGRVVTPKALAEDLHLDRGDGELLPSELPGALAWIDVLYPAAEGRTTLGERVTRPLSDLLRAKIFESVLGQGLSLEDIVAALHENGSVRYATRPYQEAGPEARAVVRVSTRRSVELLACLFGDGALEESSDWLEELERREVMATLPAVEELELDRGEALVAVPVEREGFRGAVGLTAVHPGGTLRTLRTKLCKGGHLVGTVASRHDLELVAIFEDDRLEMAPDFRSVARDPGAARRVEVCRQLVPDLVAALAQAWEGVRGDQGGDADRHFRDLLKLLREPSEGSSVDEEAGQRWIEDCRDVLLGIPALRTMGGEWLSVADLVARHEADGEPIDCVLDPESSGAPVADGQPILHLSRTTYREVRRLKLFALRDYTNRWADERAMARWLKKAPRVEPVEEVPSIHHLSVRLTRGVKGTLSIPAAPLEQSRLAELPKARFTLHDRLAGELPISEVFPCSGVIDGVPFEIVDERLDLTMPVWLATRLESKAYRLYETLCDRYETDDFVDDEERETARSYLAMALSLNLARSTERSGKHHRRSRRLERAFFREPDGGPLGASELMRRLCALPLFRLDDGSLITAEVVVRERPMDLTPLLLWSSRIDDIERLVGGATPPELRVDPAGKRAPKAASRHGTAESHGETTPAEPERAEPERAEPERAEPVASPTRSAPVRLTREERLARALRKELGLVRDGNEGLLGEADLSPHLERLEVDYFRGCSPVFLDGQEVIVNGATEVVQEVLERFEDDPTWTSFLASSVFSVLNRELHDITDTDEEHFHQKHLALVLSRGRRQ